MAKEMQNSSKLNMYRQTMSDLIKGIFGYKQIDFDPKGEDSPKAVTIKLRHNDLVRSFKQTRIYQRNFRILFQYTFSPLDGTSTDYCIGNQDLEINAHPRQEYIHTILMNTIQFYVDEETQKDIFHNYQLVQNKYEVMTCSIFDVMTHYRSVNGIPVICTKEQEKACLDKFGDQAMPEEQEKSSTSMCCTVKDIFREHPETEEIYLGLIGSALVDRVLPLFFDEALSDDAFQQKYAEATSKLRDQIKEQLIEDARRITAEHQHAAEEIKQIILVDPAYQFDKPEMKVMYVPEHAPLLADWHIPVHSYIHYQRPEIQYEEMKTFTSAFLGGKPLLHELVHPRTDEPISSYPISEKKVPYWQGMFQDYQIFYLTNEYDPRFSSSLFEYLGNQDEYISKAIEEANEDFLEAYWKSVLESLEDILSRLFRNADSFSDLIQETELPRKEFVYQEEAYHREGKGYQAYLAEFPDQKISGMDSWMMAFGQEKLLMLDEDKFSAFLPQEQIYRHYVLQWEGLPATYRDLLGDDFVSASSTRQLAYILIPLIGDFTVELEQNALCIANAAKNRMTVNKFQYHLHCMKKYALDKNLETAIQVWDNVYKAMKHRSFTQQKLLTHPAQELLGLQSYAKENGNLFQNLKDALELYCSYLET